MDDLYAPPAVPQHDLPTAVLGWQPDAPDAPPVAAADHFDRAFWFAFGVGGPALWMGCTVAWRVLECL